MKLRTITEALLALLPCTASMAQAPVCDDLTAEQKVVAQQVMTSYYPYACCDDTISACLTTEPSCKLPKLLASEACRMAAVGKSAKDIKHVFDQRALSMSPHTPPVRIEMRPEHVWGNPEAKTIVSIYLCGRCPYCSRHVPAFIEALEKSSLKDRVAVNLRLFPIKTHENSTQAALGVEAAAQMGQGWPFLLKIYKNFDQYTNDSMMTWAGELGLDKVKFDAWYKNPAVRNYVVASKKEGFVNQVESTPTFFLNGHKIQGAFDVDSLLSMIEEVTD